MASSSPKLQLAPLSIPPHICNFGSNIIGIFSFPLLFSVSAVFLYLYDFLWLLITYQDSCCPHGFSDKALHFIFLCTYVRILGCFINYTLQQKKRCNTSRHPSRVYINQIWKNFFPKTSLEGLATWSKKVTQGSLFVARTYFLVGPDLCRVNF